MVEVFPHPNYNRQLEKAEESKWPCTEKNVHPMSLSVIMFQSLFREGECCTKTKKPRSAVIPLAQYFIHCWHLLLYCPKKQRNNDHISNHWLLYIRHLAVSSLTQCGCRPLEGLDWENSRMWYWDHGENDQKVINTPILLLVTHKWDLSSQGTQLLSQHGQGWAGRHTSWFIVLCLSIQNTCSLIQEWRLCETVDVCVLDTNVKIHSDRSSPRLPWRSWIHLLTLMEMWIPSQNHYLLHDRLCSAVVPGSD